MTTVNSYTTLNHPFAQLEAAARFCGGVRSAEDMWADMYERPPMDLDGFCTANVLDELATLGLRFEVAGTEGFEEYSDGYFCMDCDGSALDNILWGHARQVAMSMREYVGDDETEEPSPELWALVTFHGCGHNDFIFVPDSDGVSSAAYQLLCSHNEFVPPPTPKRPKRDKEAEPAAKVKKSAGKSRANGRAHVARP
jgi:hypothetical protein